MVSTAVLVMFGVLALGTALTLLGLRGRRINRKPVCRDCGFDLTGVVARDAAGQPGTCPECGAGLGRPAAIRIGQRRRMPLAAGLGVVLVVLAVAPMGMMGYAALTGSDLNAHKPIGLLLWEARRASPSQRDAICAELTTRISAGELDDAQRRLTVETALAIQADLSRPWNEAWGDLVETAHLDGVATDEQFDRYSRRALVVEISARGEVPAFTGSCLLGSGEGPHAVLPMRIKVKEVRAGASSRCMGSVYFSEGDCGREPVTPVWMTESFTSIGGARVTEHRLLNDHDADRPIASLHVFGSKMSGLWAPGGTGDQSVIAVLRLPGERADGREHVVRGNVHVESNVFSGNARAHTNGRLEETRAMVYPTEFKVRIQEPESPTHAVRSIPPDDETRERLERLLRPSSVHVYESQSSTTTSGPDGKMRTTHSSDAGANITITDAETDPPLAHEAFVFLNGSDKPQYIGYVTSGHALVEHLSYRGPKGARSLNAHFAGKGVDEIETLDLLLVPRPELMALTLDQTGAYNGELRFDGLSLRKDGFSRGRPARATQKDPGANEDESGGSTDE